VNPAPVLAGSAVTPDWQAAGFGVYIHWPFCLAKCPYCDFNSHVSRQVDHRAWRAALIAEMRHMHTLSGPRPVDTMFFGGGTPSLMEPATVAALIDEADRLWGLAPDTEITLEANPTSVEALRFRAYGEAGVNRISIGVQALNDADLKALGRMHSVAEARAAFDIARATFNRVSFDLIYARMGQSVAEWAAELAEALVLAADHLSLYQLTIEPGTRFGDLYDIGKLSVPPDDTAVEMYELTQEMTLAAGMPGYEISNHARPGAESRHNLNYWRYGDYAGIGPGAHGRITRADGARVATVTARQPDQWLGQVGERGNAIVEAEPLSPAEQAAEYMLMSMRLGEGADTSRYGRLAGTALPAERIAALGDSGLLDVADGRLKATPAGRLVLNRLLAELLS